jgi:hypothetical protein
MERICSDHPALLSSSRAKNFFLSQKTKRNRGNNKNNIISSKNLLNREAPFFFLHWKLGSTSI